MAEKKERKLTPVGIAKWAHLQTPKAPYEGKGDPKYQIDIVFPANDEAWAAWAKDIQDKVRALPEMENKKTGEKLKKHSPVKFELNENDERTGNFYVTFKTGSKFKPPTFYKQKDPVDILVGNGSKVVVSYSEDTFSNNAVGSGIVLYLNAVQVKELVEYGNRTADSFGFETEPEVATDDIPF